MHREKHASGTLRLINLRATALSDSAVWQHFIHFCYRYYVNSLQTCIKKTHEIFGTLWKAINDTVKCQKGETFFVILWSTTSNIFLRELSNLKTCFHLTKILIIKGKETMNNFCVSFASSKISVIVAIISTYEKMKRTPLITVFQLM